LGSTGQELVELAEGEDTETAGAALEGATTGGEDWGGEGTGSTFHHPIFLFLYGGVAVVKVRLGAVEVFVAVSDVLGHV
jgi:hypothetical protein